MRKFILAAALCSTPFATAAAQTVQFDGSYEQDFDALGPTGTTLTTLGSGEWTSWRSPSGTDNNTWKDANGISASGVALMALINDTSGGQNGLGLYPYYENGVFTPFFRPGGVNAAGSLDVNDPDRSLGTSPTSRAGNAAQLSLTNNTGGALNSLNIAFNTTVLTVEQDQELPGYRFFYSLNGASGDWIAAAGLNAVTASGAPLFTQYNTAGLLNLNSAWAPGSTLLLRFVDDNAFATSPDQMIAIDDVVIGAAAAVPEPSTWAMMLAGFGLIGGMMRRRGVKLAFA